jgi:hypothetical protein
MRQITFFIVIIFFSAHVSAQQRVNKLSVNMLNNLYSYGDGQGHLNNVVRLAEDINFRYKTYNTVKRKGMIYELEVTNRQGYYKNVLPGNSVLEVSDLYANANLIFPVFIIHKKNMEHSFGTGIGVGTLMSRDYTDETNTVLLYNSTSLKEVKFGRYYTSALILDYEYNFNLSKKVGFALGLRYTTSTPVHSSNLTYTISQGTNIGFKYGLFYKFR